MNGNIDERLSGDQLLHAVAHVALAQAGDGRVDGDDQRGTSGGVRAFDRAQRDVAAADEVELIPDGTARRCCHVLDRAAGQRRQDVRRARRACRASGRFFTARVEHPAAADRREQNGQIERRAEHRRSQIARAGGDRGPRPERHVFERPAVFAQRDFGVGAAVDVVEDDARKALLRREPQVGYADGATQHAGRHPRRFYRSVRRRPARFKRVPDSTARRPPSWARAWRQGLGALTQITLCYKVMRRPRFSSTNGG